MTASLNLSIWPEDDRDRKRAPVQCEVLRTSAAY